MKITSKKSAQSVEPSFPKSGKLGFPMTNDYLFRALLQKNNDVLKGLIGALLHMNIDMIMSATIQNPIELGKSFDEKTFILDMQILATSISMWMFMTTSFSMVPPLS